MSKLVFLPSEDEILVDEVQNNPILYDMKLTEYRNIITKDKIWKDIATKIGKSTDDTKKRGKNIRDSYSRNKRNKPGTGSAASSKKKWSLATHLTFLDEVECERDSICNVILEQNTDVSLDEERDDTLCEATNDLPAEGFTKKRGFSKSKSVADLLTSNSKERYSIIQKIMDQNKEILDKKEDNVDELDLFFKSMAATAKKLPTKGKLEAKRKIFSLMIELEEKYLLYEQPVNPNTVHQMSNVHVPHIAQQHFQTLDSIQPSPSGSMYSTSSDSQFSMFNYDDPLALHSSNL